MINTGNRHSFNNLMDKLSVWTEGFALSVLGVAHQCYHGFMKAVQEGNIQWESRTYPYPGTPITQRFSHSKYLLWKQIPPCLWSYFQKLVWRHVFLFVFETRSHSITQAGVQWHNYSLLQPPPPQAQVILPPQPPEYEDYRRAPSHLVNFCIFCRDGVSPCCPV